MAGGSDPCERPADSQIPRYSEYDRRFISPSPGPFGTVLETVILRVHFVVVLIPFPWRIEEAPEVASVDGEGFYGLILPETVPDRLHPHEALSRSNEHVDFVVKLMGDLPQILICRPGPT